MGNRGFVVNAFWAKKPIASSIYLFFGKKVIYKYGASDKEYQHLRANNLVMWEAIKWCCEHGYESLCLGRTDPGHQGLEQYKVGWGAKEKEIKYYKYDLKKNIFISGSQKRISQYQFILKKMPISILNIS